MNLRGRKNLKSKKIQRHIVLGDNDVLIDTKYLKGWEKIKGEDGSITVVFQYTGKDKITVKWEKPGFTVELLLPLVLAKVARMMDAHRI